MEQVLGKFVENADGAKRDVGEDELENESDPHPASAQAPKVEATKDNDFISNKGGGVMNPRFSGNQDNDSMVRNISYATINCLLLYIFLKRNN